MIQPTGLLEFTRGFDNGETFGFLLLDEAAANVSHLDQVVDDIVAGEYAATGYVRDTVITEVITIVPAADATSPGYIQYEAADADFGTPSGGDRATQLVLFHDTGLDTTSEIVGAWFIDHTADGVTPALFPMPSNGWLRVATRCG